jgi:hypothetical protein
MEKCTSFSLSERKKFAHVPAKMLRDMSVNAHAWGATTVPETTEVGSMFLIHLRRALVLSSWLAAL